MCRMAATYMDNDPARLIVVVLGDFAAFQNHDVLIQPAPLVREVDDENQPLALPQISCRLHLQ